MKTPKDYLAEMQMGDDVLFNRHEVSVWLSDFIAEIQKESYNAAIQDAADNANADFNVVGEYTIIGENEIECYIIKDSILKLKIK